MEPLGEGKHGFLICLQGKAKMGKGWKQPGQESSIQIFVRNLVGELAVFLRLNQRVGGLHSVGSKATLHQIPESCHVDIGEGLILRHQLQQLHGAEFGFRQQSRIALAGIKGSHKPVELFAQLFHVSHHFGGDVQGITGHRAHRENLPVVDYLLTPKVQRQDCAVFYDLNCHKSDLLIFVWWSDYSK